MRLFRRTWMILAILALLVIVMTRCIGEPAREKKGKKTGFSDFAGSESCRGCHAEIHHSHLQTAHYLSSAPATEASVLGSFVSGENSFDFNPLVRIMMEKRDSSLYQVEYVRGQERRVRRFDMAIGSGTRGQTYLYWWKDTLAQLPISYFTALQEWTNSPGYSNRVIFGRPVTSRCLECHTSYAEVISKPESPIDRFDRNKIIYGIDCEKCHGPSLKHVEYHQKNATDTMAHYVANPAKFDRQTQLDLCALCHGGRLEKTSPSFSFMPGDRLSRHFKMDTVSKSVMDIDVHGNQYGMLAASACFQKSEMTCNSCHSSHINEKGKTALYAERCQSCHKTMKVKDCGLLATQGNIILDKCSTCHMPEQPSGSIMVLREGEEVPVKAKMHTHYVAVYR